MTTKTLTAEEKSKLIEILRARFEKNMKRHKGLAWKDVETKIKKSSKKLWSLSEMERTGGEPDVVGFDKKTGEYIFNDCSDESPKGRRSCCYDEASRKARKEHAPETSAVGMAQAMGIKLLNEDEYRKLQKVGDFDLKTSTWIDTPEPIRKLGGALFCDKRYESVFTYHNGAESYYASRGFRGSLRV
jgi:hypothetical protein